MKRILLTGATGFVGGQVVRQALLDGCEVVGLARPGPARTFSQHPIRGLQLLPVEPGLPGLRARLADWRPDVVLHLATFYVPDGTPDGPAQLLAANLTFPVDLLEALAAHGPTCFITAGTQWQHARGSADYAPNSFYAATKQAFEDVLRHYAEQHGFRTMVLKLSDCYAADDPRDRLVKQLVAAQKDGKTVDMSPGFQEIDLLHVRDAAAGFLAAARGLADGTLEPSQSWALRGGRPINLRRLAALIAKIGGRPVAARFGALPYRQGTVMSLWPQPVLPGWTPQVTLEKGLAELIARAGEGSG